MKRLLTLILSVLVIAVGGMRAAFAADTIGTVDYDKLVRSYNRAQIFQDDMKSKQAEAVEQLQKGLEEKLEGKVNEYSNLQESQAKALETDMNNTIETVAKGKNLSIILAKQTVFVGGTDITNDVLSRLNAGSAAPASK
jgi:Skp family chaperone for outer membrane proteins